MRALQVPRAFLVVWLVMILGFCVYGFLATHELPEESFCRAMYAVLSALSALCIGQVLEPIAEGLRTEDGAIDAEWIDNQLF